MKAQRDKAQRGDPFARIARAADAAAEQVLEEDRLLRQYGIEPVTGRSR